MNYIFIDGMFGVPKDSSISNYVNNKSKYEGSEVIFKSNLNGKLSKMNSKDRKKLMKFRDRERRIELLKK